MEIMEVSMDVMWKFAEKYNFVEDLNEWGRKNLAERKKSQLETEPDEGDIFIYYIPEKPPYFELKDVYVNALDLLKNIEHEDHHKKEGEISAEEIRKELQEKIDQVLGKDDAKQFKDRLDEVQFRKNNHCIRLGGVVSNVE